jgi:DNA mismatch repair protein MutS
MAKNKLSPVRKQYLEIKKDHPDEIVFFRLGDFYETFDEDAEITSRELDIVLTSRNVSKNQRIPMAGIPFHAAENYLGRLLKKGYHVAICEQVGEQPKNGLFDRKVVRILSPGTVINPDILSSSASNYLASVFPSNEAFGLAYADLSTGDFSVTSLNYDNTFNNLFAELSRIQPSEVIIPESFNFNGHPGFFLTKLPDWKFELGRCQQNLKRQLQVGILDGFGLKNKALQTISAGVIVDYVREHDPSALGLLKQLRSYSIHDHMVLDEPTRRNLELTSTLSRSAENGSLIQIIDKTKTPMGKRLIQNWINQPLIFSEEINNRLDIVEYLVENGIVSMEIQELLRKFSDFERIINRILVQHASPRDLISLKNSLLLIPNLKIILEGSEILIGKLNAKLFLSESIVNVIQNSIIDDPPATLKKIGVVRAGYSEKLDAVVEATQTSRDWIANLEKNEKEKTGIKTLRVGYNKIYGYYIEISKAQAELAPDSYIRKQTLVNSERFVTVELKEYETLVLNAEERIHAIESQLFKQICETIGAGAENILRSAKAVAIIDVLASFAQAAVENQYCKPEILEGKEIRIFNGRHPVVEKTHKQFAFVPNNTSISSNEFIHILTGPNMSGKSTYLRQVALIVLMAQIGSFVPADSARIGLVDRIFTRIGAQDEIHSGLSTFMVEMVETANILNSATSSSLLILDEIGRGTSTYDGLSIAWAVLEYIHNHPKLKPRTLFATHYHELTHLPETLPNMRNYNVAVSENGNDIIFLHKIIEGRTDRSYGIHVAQMAGVPKSITVRAYELLEQLERSNSDDQVRIVDQSKQMTFFKPHLVLDELESLDLNTVSPIDALNILFEWKKKNKE